jgi:hypothetical protein
VTIEAIKQNIDNFSMNDLSHFWKMAKLYMDRSKSDGEEFNRLKMFQNFLEKRMKSLK